MNTITQIRDKTTNENKTIRKINEHRKRIIKTMLNNNHARIR